MNDKALVGLVKSRLAFARDWHEMTAQACGVEPENERVFDVTEAIVGREAEEVIKERWEWLLYTCRTCEYAWREPTKDEEAGT